MDALEEQQQHLPAAATQQAAADCVVINMEHVVMDIQLHQPAGNNIAAAASQHDDVNPLPCCVDMNDDDDDGSSCCCVVCTEPMEWVAVGRCGHRVMCSQCMVRIRFFHQNKRCCICRTRCPKVIVTRWPAGAAVGNPPQLPLFAFREGRVGHFWYHKLTAAYFEDQQQYNVARAACHGILSPFYQPLFWFIFWYTLVISVGAFMGSSFAALTKETVLQFRAYDLAIFCAVLVATFFWSIPKCTQDPLQLESSMHKL